MADMKVTFEEFWKVRDVIAHVKDDLDLARVMSRVISDWEGLEDVESGEPIPLPEFDTGDWYEQLLWPQWIELVNLFTAARDAQTDVPN